MQQHLLRFCHVSGCFPAADFSSGCDMHTLFTLEDLYGLTVSEADGEICLKVDTSKGKDRSRTPENAVRLERAG